MSERMIELQRARLLAAGKGNPAVAAGNTTLSKRPTVSPRQAAINTVKQDDEQLSQFLQRLDSRGPTVPTALCRRVLHQQGAGFLDETVAAVTSAAADRFLATVLQQAVACRDQRLRGAEMAREAMRQRRRHFAQYEADADDRKRRKKEHEEKLERARLSVISAADAVKKEKSSTAATTGGGDAPKPKKKKKVEINSDAVKILKKLEEQDEEDSYDSIDEEEQYYRSYYGDEVPHVDDEDEEDEVLTLRDLERPLEAWNFHVTGKIGMHLEKKQRDESDDENAENENDSDGAEDDMDADSDDAESDNGSVTENNNNSSEQPPKKKAAKKPRATKATDEATAAATTTTASAATTPNSTR